MIIKIVSFLDDYPFDLLHPGFPDFFSKSGFVQSDLLLQLLSTVSERKRDFS